MVPLALYEAQFVEVRGRGYTIMQDLAYLSEPELFRDVPYHLMSLTMNICTGEHKWLS